MVLRAWLVPELGPASRPHGPLRCSSRHRALGPAHRVSYRRFSPQGHRPTVSESHRSHRRGSSTGCLVPLPAEVSGRPAFRAPWPPCRRNSERSAAEAAKPRDFANVRLSQRRNRQSDPTRPDSRPMLSSSRGGATPPWQAGGNRSRSPRLCRSSSASARARDAQDAGARIDFKARPGRREPESAACPGRTNCSAMPCRAAGSTIGPAARGGHRERRLHGVFYLFED
jgi:hypothetical protein